MLNCTVRLRAILAPTMKTAAFALGTIMVLIGLGVTAHHVYEAHLSSGYAPILEAALDPNASDADEASYLRQARVASRTDKDRETNDKLDRAFLFAAQNCSEQLEHSTQLSERSIELSMQYTSAMQRHEFERGSTEEKAAYARSLEMDAEADAASKEYKECSASSAKYNNSAFTMFQELRATAGLQPLKPKAP
jgi:hypothetical protein